MGTLLIVLLMQDLLILTKKLQHLILACPSPGQVIKFVCSGACSMVWASKLQKETCLSTTEAEYEALSESLKDVLFFMPLVEETQ